MCDFVEIVFEKGKQIGRGAALRTILSNENENTL